MALFRLTTVLFGMVLIIGHLIPTAQAGIGESYPIFFLLFFSFLFFIIETIKNVVYLVFINGKGKTGTSYLYAITR